METETPENSENTSIIHNPITRKKKMCFILAGLAGLIILIYFGCVIYYSGHFFHSTLIDGISYADAAPAMADNTRQSMDLQYSITLQGREEAMAVLSAADFGLVYSYSKTMDEIKGEQNAFLWFLHIFDKNEYTLDRSVSYNEAQLITALSKVSFLQEENMREPADAYICDFDETAGCYVITPQDPGTLVDQEALLLAVENAIENHETVVDLDIKGCYVAPDICADDNELISELAKLNAYMDASITYQFGEELVVLDFSVFHDWIEPKEEGVSFNAVAIEEYLTELGEQYDTYNEDENFTTVEGYIVNLPKGRFGWRIDTEAETVQLIADIMECADITREPVFSTVGGAWGENDIGDFYVEVNLTAQKVYVIDQGEILFETDCVTGNMSNGCATPAGIFGITYRQQDAILRGDDYESHVKYWMPFNGNIGFHDASWRVRFGGNIFMTSGSHGCVNLPTTSAATIFDYVYKDCPVICYYLTDDVIVERPASLSDNAAGISDNAVPTPAPAPSPVPSPIPSAEPTPVPPAVSDNSTPAVSDNTVMVPTPTLSENTVPVQ